MMINVTNNSIYRIPVGMNVCNIHKDRNHQTTVMKIFMLIYFLYHNDTTIGRGYDNFFCFTIEQTDRATEKICHQQVKNDAGKSYDVERHFAL